MSYTDICPICGSNAVSVTRGVPSFATCEKRHKWEREKPVKRNPSKYELATRETLLGLADQRDRYKEALEEIDDPCMTVHRAIKIVKAALK